MEVGPVLLFLSFRARKGVEEEQGGNQFMMGLDDLR
jgi:hypothetical protein